MNEDDNPTSPIKARGRNKSFEMSVKKEIYQAEDSNASRESSDQGGRTRGSRRLRNLNNSDKFMANFDPEKSTREMRKIERRMHKESGRKNQLFDEGGRFLENGKDLCDCLIMDCPGCHFPCTKCGSEKCGLECRCNRRWYYEQIQVEGTTLCFKWPQMADAATSTPEEK